MSQLKNKKSKEDWKAQWSIFGRLINRKIARKDKKMLLIRIPYNHTTHNALSCIGKGILVFQGLIFLRSIYADKS